MKKQGKVRVLYAEPTVASCDDCGASADEPCDSACPSHKAAVADEERELDRDHPECAPERWIWEFWGTENGYAVDRW